MGFDLTGLNPRIKGKEPKEPNDIWENESVRKVYFKKRQRFLNKNKGVYFRNNCWWWRPLANYVLEYTKVIDKKNQQTWQFNDCSEVDEHHATQIANQLDHLIKSGHTKKYEKTYEHRREIIEGLNKGIEKELSTFSKSVEKKLNKPDLAPCDFPEEDKKKWDRIYSKRNSDGHYPFAEKNVKEFSEFCRNSGGFTIG